MDWLSNAAKSNIASNTMHLLFTGKETIKPQFSKCYLCQKWEIFITYLRAYMCTKYVYSLPSKPPLLN